MKTKNALSLGALTLEITKTAGGRIQFFPAGKFRSTDFRPEECAHWQMNDDIAKRVIERLRMRKNDLVIDYEHQTFLAEENGKPAIAAGWFAPSSVFYDNGLFADAPKWTPAALQAIENDEYRYISPVFIYDPRTGEILELINAALTNNPGLDGMERVKLTAARLTARLNQTNPEPELIPMNKELLEILRKLLGLPGDASEEQILQALQAIAGDMEQQKDEAGAAMSSTLPDFIKKSGETISALKTAALAAKTAQADPTKFVPMAQFTELATNFAALQSKIGNDEVNGLVTAALKDGRLTATLKDWATDLGKTNIAALRNYLETAQPIAALTGMQTKDVTIADGKVVKLTQTQREVAKSLGITEAEFAEALTAEEAK
jgi:phage I-like protein